MIGRPLLKALRDLRARPGRAALTVAALTGGAFQVAMLLSTYAMLRPVLRGFYAETHPASAIVTLDRVEDATLADVRAVAGVADVESRAQLIGRVRDARGGWVPALAGVIEDFDHQHLDRFTPDRGAWPPGPGDVLLERTALRVAGVAIGDSISVRSGDAPERRVRVAGTVHAPGLPPAWMEHMVPMFVGRDSRLLDPRAEVAPQLRVLATHPLDEGAIRETAERVAERLRATGHTVGRVSVPPPGRHPHAGQMEAFLFLLLAFGVLSLLLSSVLLASMVHAFMAEQVREVGILTAIGATRGRIAGIYLAQVGALALAALALAVPAGVMAGRAYAAFAGGILNVDVTRAPAPLAPIVLVIVLGLAIPLALASGPLRRAARVGVREALGDDGAPGERQRALDPWIGRARWVSRPLALTLRATFARRSRVLLAIGLMGAGGAVFMAALDVGAAWRGQVREDFGRRAYDLAVNLEAPAARAEVKRALAGVPAVASWEDWAGGSPYLVGRDGAALVTTALLGVDPSTPLLRPRVVSGRALSVGSPRGVLVNPAVLRITGPLVPGDSVRVRARGRTRAFVVDGVVRELLPMPIVYATRGAVLEALGQSPDSARMLRIVTRGHTDAAERSAAVAVEDALRARGIAVAGIQRSTDALQGLLDHLVIILSALTLSAVVVVLVGALGLTATVTLSVIQRTRELGIMSALGATPRVIERMVWTEAVLLALAGWLVACVLTVPVSFALEAVCGRIFVQTPLEPYVWPMAPVLWLAISLALASLGSVHPARRASRSSVRAALAHT